MSVDEQIRKKLKTYKIKSELGPDVQSLGVELTVCQLVVVVMSFLSATFIFVPLLFLQNWLFMVIFFGLSISCLVFGIWFWLNKGKICENPEDYQS